MASSWYGAQPTNLDVFSPSIYVLKEAGLLAFEHLVSNLKPFGYEPVKFTPGVLREQGHYFPYGGVLFPRDAASPTQTSFAP